MTECRICGGEVTTEDASTQDSTRLCGDCTELQDRAELLMNKSPRNAIHYFTELFMQARRRTLSEENLKNCIWEAWWRDQKNNCSTRI